MPKVPARTPAGVTRASLVRTLTDEAAALVLRRPSIHIMSISPPLEAAAGPPLGENHRRRPRYQSGNRARHGWGSARSSHLLSPCDVVRRRPSVRPPRSPAAGIKARRLPPPPERIPTAGGRPRW